MRSTRFQGQNPLMQYSPDEQGRIEREAREIARQTGWPLAVARAQAMAEVRKTQDRPKAEVVPPNQGKLFGAG